MLRVFAVDGNGLSYSVAHSDALKTYSNDNVRTFRRNLGAGKVIRLHAVMVMTSLLQVTVGVLANILAVPPHILIVELLKRSKKRRRSAQKYAIDQTSPNLEEAEDKLWPWWCRVLGYMLLALTICGSALGIVLLGMSLLYSS